MKKNSVQKLINSAFITDKSKVYPRIELNVNFEQKKFFFFAIIVDMNTIKLAKSEEKFWVKVAFNSFLPRLWKLVESKLVTFNFTKKKFGVLFFIITFSGKPSLSVSSRAPMPRTSPVLPPRPHKRLKRRNN